MSKRTSNVSLERWQEAQKEELQCWTNAPYDSEDWNLWWATKFSNYDFLANENITSVYEVGCGPYAKNIDHVFRAMQKMPNRILLEDPLLDSYVSLQKSVCRFMDFPNAKLISKPMEDFTLQELGIDDVDLVICNNVLDHVKSVEACFKHMDTSLKSGGILILGQDLTNDEDERNHPDLDDVMHPITIDENNIMKFLTSYDVIKKEILPREMGRNPNHHYGTLLFVGRKK